MHHSDGHQDIDSDTDLVERIRSTDDERAFSTLITRYYQPLTSFICRYTHTIDAAEDIAQELFVRLWDRRAYWVVRGSVRVYLFSAARNAARDALASQSARHR